MDSSRADGYSALMIGEKAPHFQANTTFGVIHFPEDYKGKWVVFFSHPGDYTPVCTTEIMTFASRNNEFEAHNCKLLGLSVDSNPSHIEWVKAIEGYTWKNIRDPKITFPIIADDFGMIARQFGMLMPASSTTKTVRTVFFIDPEGTVRAILGYPLTTGRNIDEILRLLLALQAYDETGNPTPCDWQPGEPHVLPPPQTLPEAQQRSGGHGPGGSSCIDWYLCFTRDGNNAGGVNNRSAGPAALPYPGAMLPIQSPVMPHDKPPLKAPQPTPFVIPIQPIEPFYNNPNTAMRGAANFSGLPNSPSQKQNELNLSSKQPEMPSSNKSVPTMAPPSMTPPLPTNVNRLFTTEELKGYNGRDGKPAYGVVDGVVYDLTPALKVPSHEDLMAGSDLSDKFHSCHDGREHLLSLMTVVGFMRDSGTATRPLSSTEVMARPAPERPQQPLNTREISIRELALYNGKGGMPAYGAVNGVVYDLKSILGSDSHKQLKPGTDMTNEFSKCHLGMNYLLYNLPIVGKLK